MINIIFYIIDRIRTSIGKRRLKYVKKIILKTSKQCKGQLSVNGYSRVTKKTILGSNVNFNGMIIEGNGNINIGDNFHSGKDCKIISQIHNYEGCAIPYDNTYILKDIIIEDNVWLGDRVMILAGIIGEGSIIQAGSVVTGNIPKYSIAGGHPAKVFKYRDTDHYEKLKKEEKFH